MDGAGVALEPIAPSNLARASSSFSSRVVCSFADVFPNNLPIPSLLSSSPPGPSFCKSASCPCMKFANSLSSAVTGSLIGLEVTAGIDWTGTVAGTEASSRTAP